MFIMIAKISRDQREGYQRLRNWIRFAPFEYGTKRYRIVLLKFVFLIIIVVFQ